MAAYLIGQVMVHDLDRFARYVAETSALIARFGGEVLDVVRAVEAVEGTWPVGARTALVRFPDEQALRAFWDSPERIENRMRITGNGRRPTSDPSASPRRVGNRDTSLPKLGWSPHGSFYGRHKSAPATAPSSQAEPVLP